MAKKTAVQWLLQQFMEKQYGVACSREEHNAIINQALSLEREQQQKDFEAGRHGDRIESSYQYKDFTDYFNQNYV